MRSASDVDHHRPDPRCRDRAVRRHGFSVGLRAIAKAAGVSAGLVIHHFGSKDGLRKACDDYIAEHPQAETESLQSSDPATWFAADGRDRALRADDGLPGPQHAVRRRAGEVFWQHMIDNTEQYLEEGVRAGTLKPSRDPKARAKFLGMTGGGGFLLYLQMHDNPTDLRAVLRDYGEDMCCRARALHQGLLTTRRCTTRSSPATNKEQQMTSIGNLTNRPHAIDVQAWPRVSARCGARRPRPDRRRGRGARLPRPERRGQVDDHPRPARPRPADGGTVRLLGGDPWTDAVALHRQIAYVPGDVTLWPTLTGGETIDLLARMRGGSTRSAGPSSSSGSNLDPHKKARTYSKGNRQKVSLISAFSSHARLLLLDEPSSGWIR